MSINTTINANTPLPAELERAQYTIESKNESIWMSLDRVYIVDPKIKTT